MPRGKNPTAASRAFDREYARRYRAANRERVLAAKRAYRAAHLEQERVYANNYRRDHPEECRERERLRNITRKGYRQAYRTAHPEKHRAYNHQRRASRYGTLATATIEQERAILVAYKGRCAYCRAKLAKPTIDHVVPFIRGGQHTPENIVPACQSCNSSKGTKDPVVVPVLRLMM